MTPRDLYNLPPAVRLSYLQRCERQLNSLTGLRLELRTTYDYDRLRGVTLDVRTDNLRRWVRTLKETA